MRGPLCRRMQTGHFRSPLQAVLLSSIIAASVHATPPLAPTQYRDVTYDARSALPQCTAFQPMNQTGCQACCAAALAAAAAARACVRDRRNIQYSVQRIWDCAYDSVLSCDYGARPSQFFSTLFNKDALAHIFAPLPVQTTADRPVTPPNATACAAFTTNESVTSFKMAQNADLQSEATQVLEQEIWEYGPVVAVVHFKEQADFRLFQTWASSAADRQTLYPAHAFDVHNTSAPDYAAHCVSVIGWGADYWLIQNSYGASWAHQGVAKMARNRWGIEQTWFALGSAPLPCTARNAGDCLPPGVELPQKETTRIPNAAIAMTTLGCIFLVAALLFACYKPAPPVPEHSRYELQSI